MALRLILVAQSIAAVTTTPGASTVADLHELMEEEKHQQYKLIATEDSGCVHIRWNGYSSLTDYG